MQKSHDQCLNDVYSNDQRRHDASLMFNVQTKSHFLSDLCPYANVQTPSSNM